MNDTRPMNETPSDKKPAQSKPRWEAVPVAEAQLSPTVHIPWISTSGIRAGQFGGKRIDLEIVPALRALRVTITETDKARVRYVPEVHVLSWEPV